MTGCLEWELEKRSLLWKKMETKMIIPITSMSFHFFFISIQCPFIINLVAMLINLTLVSLWLGCSHLNKWIIYFFHIIYFILKNNLFVLLFILLLFFIFSPLNKENIYVDINKWSEVGKLIKKVSKRDAINYIWLPKRMKFDEVQISLL